MAPGIRDILRARASLLQHSNGFPVHPHIRLVSTMKVQNTGVGQVNQWVEYDSEVKRDRYVVNPKE